MSKRLEIKTINVQIVDYIRKEINKNITLILNNDVRLRLNKKTVQFDIRGKQTIFTIRHYSNDCEIIIVKEF